MQCPRTISLYETFSVFFKGNRSVDVEFCSKKKAELILKKCFEDIIGSQKCNKSIYTVIL